MTTYNEYWQFEMYLFVHRDDGLASQEYQGFTRENREWLARIVAKYSGESWQSEYKMFDSAVKLSVNGSLPAIAYGVKVPCLPAMRDEFALLFQGFTRAKRWYVVAKIPIQGRQVNELLLTNDGGEAIGQVFTWQDALADIQTDFGLVPIVSSEG